jgi:solute:Na+ symporter, SSS family
MPDSLKTLKTQIKRYSASPKYNPTDVAAMSSLDSSMNAVSAVFVTDIYRCRLCRNRDERHYLFVSRMIAAIAAVIMVALATLIAYSDTKTIQHTGAVMGSILGSGLLGLFFFGFFTKLGDSRAILVGIICTIFYTVYIVLGQKDILPMPRIDLYYTAIIGNLVMFTGNFIGSMIFRRSPDAPSLENLTVWTMTAGKRL